MTSITRVYSVIVPGAHLMPALLGQRDGNLRIIEQAFPAATIVVRGNEITIDGPHAELVSRLFEELIVLLQGGHHLDEGTLQRSIAMMHDNERPSTVLTDDIMRGAKGKPVRPKSAGPEALHRRHPQQRDHLRARPGGHRQELVGGGDGRAGAADQAGSADHPHPAGRRGRRASRFPARRSHGQDRSVPASRCTTRCTTWSSRRARSGCSNGRRWRSRRWRSCVAAR